MKSILILLSLALCAGCKTSTSQYTVINNTPYLLKVYQDGEYRSDLQPGLIHRVQGTLLGRNTIVTVTGVDTSGTFVGSDSYQYQFGVPTAWTVTSLAAAGNVPEPESTQNLLKRDAKQDIKDSSGKTTETASNSGIQKASTNQIEGAFGLKLGDSFDTNKGVLVEPARWGELVVEKHQVVYKFTPEKPLPPFESYYVELTPKTHRICSIFGAVRASPEKTEQLDVVVAALSQKYGKAEPGWGFVLYSADLDSRSIRLVRSGAQLSERSHTTVATLIYSERLLEELAERERAEIVKAARDAEQRELGKKAKALEKSGI